MKQLTKNIRKDVKALIERVGGTHEITGGDINRIYNKYVSENDDKLFTDHACDVYTTINNQINYFRYAKGL